MIFSQAILYEPFCVLIPFKLFIKVVNVPRNLALAFYVFPIHVMLELYSVGATEPAHQPITAKS